MILWRSGRPGRSLERLFAGLYDTPNCDGIASRMNNGVLVLFSSSSSSACHVMIDRSRRCISRASLKGLYLHASPRLPFHIVVFRTDSWDCKSSTWLARGNRHRKKEEGGCVILCPLWSWFAHKWRLVARGSVHNRGHNFYCKSQ